MLLPRSYILILSVLILFEYAYSMCHSTCKISYGDYCTIENNPSTCTDCYSDYFDVSLPVSPGYCIFTNYKTNPDIKNPRPILYVGPNTVIGTSYLKSVARGSSYSLPVPLTNYTTSGTTLYQAGLWNNFLTTDGSKYTRFQMNFNGLGTSHYGVYIRIIINSYCHNTLPITITFDGNPVTFSIPNYRELNPQIFMFNHNTTTLKLIFQEPALTTCDYVLFEDMTVFLIDCDSTCLSCASTTMNCSSCVVNYYFEADHRFCYLDCPGGYTEQSDFTCVKTSICHSSCLSCSIKNDANKCSSCPNTLMNFSTSPSSGSPGICTPVLLWQKFYIIDKTSIIGTNLKSFTCNGTNITALSQGISSYLYLAVAVSVSVMQFTSFTVNYIEFGMAGLGLNHSGILIRTRAYSQCTSGNKTLQLTLGSNSTTYTLTTNQQNQIEFGSFLHITDTVIFKIYFGTQAQKCFKLIQDITIYLKSCQSHCGSCTDEGKYLQPNSTACLKTCPAGYLIVSYNTTSCVACNINCTTCIDVVDKCVSCTTVNGKAVFLFNETCKQTCPNGMFANTLTKACQSCQIGCLTCTGQTLANCQSCTSDTRVNPAINYYKKLGSNGCITICDAGQYQDPYDNTCKVCFQGCIDCLNSSSNCTSCKNVSSVSYYFYNSACLLDCPTGFYKDTLNNRCLQCDDACASCTSIGRSSCQSCQNITSVSNNVSTTVIFYKDTNSDICSQTCAAGQFIDANTLYICQICQTQCKTCQDFADYCINCIDGYFYYSVAHSCLTVCVNGFYSNSSTKNCQPCHQGCVSCSGQSLNQCLACSTDSTVNPPVIYYKKLGSNGCLTVCQAAQYEDSLDHTCKMCFEGCADCSNGPNNCTSCTIVSDVSYFLYIQNNQNQCITQCPSGFYKDTTLRKCLICHITCKECTGNSENQCSSCQKNLTSNVDYYLNLVNDSCQTSCPDGFFAEISSLQCKPCLINCLRCVNSTDNCLQCKNTGQTRYFLTQSLHSCSSDCSVGFHKNQTNIKCQCNFFTLEGECLGSCNNDTYISAVTGKTICKTCSTLLKTCPQPIKLKLTSKIIKQSNQIQHKIVLSQGLNQTRTQTLLKNQIKVFVSGVRTSRLLEIQSESIRILQSTKFQVSVNRVTISPTRQYIYVYTYNFAKQVQIKTATVQAAFGEGILIDGTGSYYLSVTNEFQLIEPVFMKSYYEVYEQNYFWMIEGMIACVAAFVLVIITIALKNQKAFNESLNVVMMVSCFGIMRMKSYPLALSAYSYLFGFSFYEFNFIPNWLKDLMKVDEQEVSLYSVQFSLQSSNFVVSNGNALQIFLLVEIVLFIIFVASQQSRPSIERLKMMQHFVICLFLPKAMFSSVLVFYLFAQNYNNYLSFGIQFWISFGIATLITIGLIIYFKFSINQEIKNQVYKIHNALRPIMIFLIIMYPFEGMLAFNGLELLIFIIDFYFNRKRKINKYLYVLEFILITASFNLILFMEDILILMICLGFALTTIMLICVSYTLKSKKSLVSPQQIDAFQKPHKNYVKNHREKYSKRKAIKQYAQSIDFSQEVLNQSDLYHVQQSVGNGSTGNIKTFKKYVQNDQYHAKNIKSHQKVKNKINQVKNLYNNDSGLKINQNNKPQVYQGIDSLYFDESSEDIHPAISTDHINKPRKVKFDPKQDILSLMRNANQPRRIQKKNKIKTNKLQILNKNHFHDNQDLSSQDYL